MRDTYVGWWKQLPIRIETDRIVLRFALDKQLVTLSMDDGGDYALRRWNKST